MNNSVEPNVELSEERQESESDNIISIEMGKIISKKKALKKKRKILGETSEELTECHKACTQLNDLIGDLDVKGGY